MGDTLMAECKSIDLKIRIKKVRRFNRTLRKLAKRANKAADALTKFKNAYKKLDEILEIELEV